MYITIPNICIEVVSSVLPKNVLDIRSLASVFGDDKINNAIKMTGIESVFTSDKKETTADLGIKAANIIFEKSSVKPEAIDSIVFISQTPDYIMPPTSCIIQNKLGLKESITAWDINYGCSGYIYGLLQSSMLINSSNAEKILVICGDVLTKYVNKNDRNVRVVFGDAVTASIISRGEHTFEFSIFTDGSGSDMLTIPSGGVRNMYDNDSNKEHYYNDGEIRSNYNVYMDGMGIYNFTLKRIPSLINNILEKSKLGKDDIDLFIFHQANKFIIEYLCKKSKIDPKKVPLDLKYTGNTGPASIPLLLSRIGDKIINKDKNQKIMLIGFGVGLSWGACICSLNSTKFLK